MEKRILNVTFSDESFDMEISIIAQFSAGVKTVFGEMLFMNLNVKKTNMMLRNLLSGFIVREHQAYKK